MAQGSGPHPVRLTIDDDLQRSRGTVFFRALFALPFMIWLAVWGIAALAVGIANWAATLLLGRSPEPLHRFLARFVRYATHAFAYVNLAAEPLPGFAGDKEYPIDVEIDPPARQGRWGVAFRIVLVVPAVALLFVLAGWGWGVFALFLARRGSDGLTNQLNVLVVAAFLGWFYALVRGRMPHGLRDLAAYALSYAAQFWAYLLLLTDRYPSSDPRTAIGPLPVRADPIDLEVGGELRRSRLTVLFRLLLAIPHLVWLLLWGIVALGAAVLNWFATLVRGTSPRAFHRILGSYLRYQTHVVAYLYLVGNPFPGFTGAEGSYPVELRVRGPERQGRWTVLFRLFLAVPALIVATALSWLVAVAALLGWFAALVTGRMPIGLRNATAFGLRYGAQTYGYLFLVTGAYPYSGPSEPQPAPAEPPPAEIPPQPVAA